MVTGDGFDRVALTPHTAVAHGVVELVRSSVGAFEFTVLFTGRKVDDQVTREVDHGHPTVVHVDTDDHQRIGADHVEVVVGGVLTRTLVRAQKKDVVQTVHTRWTVSTSNLVDGLSDESERIREGGVGDQGTCDEYRRR